MSAARPSVSPVSRDHLARAAHAIRLCNLRPADTAAVVGEGQLALATVALALARGVGRVTLVADSKGAAQAAVAAGAAHLPRPNSDESVEAALVTLGGFGSDLVFECEGDSASRILAIRLVRPAATVVLVSDCQVSTFMNPNLLVMADKRVQGSHGYEPRDLEVAERLSRDGRFALALDVTRGCS